MAQILDSYRPRGVRDVSADKFIAAYAAHLKAGDKVRLCTICLTQPPTLRQK